MMSNNKLYPLKDGERLDELHIKEYKIIQDPNKFCFGIDAVLLSDYAKVYTNEKVVDLGTGTGIIPILLEAKTDGELFIGLEIQNEMVDMATRSVKFNNLESKIKIIEGDIKEASKIFDKNTIDVVTSNPPYMNSKNGLISKNENVAIARHELLCNLEDIIRESSALLKQKGRFYMIHRPFRLAQIFSLLSKYKLEAKRMRFVHPFIDKEPNMVLLECIKGGGEMIKIEPPLIVYNDINVYSDEIYKIYGY